MPNNFSQTIEKVADWLSKAKRVACMTGAGVSAESGVATFRDAHGLWEGHRPEEVATPEAFLADPEMVWRFYNARRTQLLDIKPNPGHYALAEMEQLCPDFCLVTQNVDNLHRVAGSNNLWELHGNIWIDKCWSCDFSHRVDSISDEPVPSCPQCSGKLRPGVVWFGEMLPEEAMTQAQAACATCDVMLVAGTSSVVYPAAGLSMVAQHAGASVVEINPAATALSATADAAIPEKSGVALPQLVEAWRKRLSA